MATTGWLTGSRALAFHTTPQRSPRDTDATLTLQGIAELSVALHDTGIPGRLLGGGWDVTVMGLHPSHEIMKRCIERDVEYAGLVLGLPSRAALWALKSGGMAWEPMREKTYSDMRFLESLLRPEDYTQDVMALRDAVWLEAKRRH